MYEDFVWTVVVLLFFALLAWLGVRAIRYAKKGVPGAQVLGAVFLLFGFGNIRDPSEDTVQQAKQLKKREEDDAGDPPNDFE